MVSPFLLALSIVSMREKATSKLMSTLTSSTSWRGKDWLGSPSTFETWLWTLALCSRVKKILNSLNKSLEAFGFARSMSGKRH